MGRIAVGGDGGGHSLGERSSKGGGPSSNSDRLSPSCQDGVLEDDNGWDTSTAALEERRRKSEMSWGDIASCCRRSGHEQIRMQELSSYDLNAMVLY